MSILDWIIVAVLNGAVVIWAVARARRHVTTGEWFLASRSLSWWVAGLSLYATAIDASDIVADSGGAYTYGIAIFTVSWLGTVAGWVLLAHAIAPAMYRLGMYTNAEYLEARFGPVTRVISVFVQTQYRTLVLAIMTKALFLTFSVACGLSAGASWGVVVAIAAIAVVYTVAGGLRAVAITDAWQSVLMVAASVLVFVLVWSAAGGWSGVRERLDAIAPGLAESHLRIGSERVTTEDVRAIDDETIGRRILAAGGRHDTARGVIERRTPGWLICFAFAIAGLAYAIVNHTESMRLLGARSRWDMKMAVALAGLLLIVVTFLNLSMGLAGRALHPELAAAGRADDIYPLLVREHAPAGMIGVVVAGIIAAVFSTYDSIGSTISALLTRDFYARLLVRDRGDAHYLAVARLLTPVIIFGSFAYLPIIDARGMWGAYLDAVGAVVVPLLGIYLAGALTPVHRRAGAIGLIVGIAWGLASLAAPAIALRYGIAILPAAITGSFATPVASLAATWIAMLATTLVLGRERGPLEAHEERRGWLRDSQEAMRRLADAHVETRGAFWPLALGLAVAALGAWLSLWVFW